MRYVLAGVLVVAGFVLGRLSLGGDWIKAVHGGERPPETASTGTSGAVSILDLADYEPKAAPNIAEQVAEACRHNEGGLEARRLRALASEPGAHPALVERAGEAEALGRAECEAEARRLEVGR